MQVIFHFPLNHLAWDTLNIVTCNIFICLCNGVFFSLFIMKNHIHGNLIAFATRDSYEITMQLDYNYLLEIQWFLFLKSTLNII
jgi:hypothetical protein